MGMKKLKLKIFKNFGIGTSHVINKDGIACIKRYGFWTPYLTIFFSKIYPITNLHNISQVYHSHQGSFVSFILKGVYLQDVLEENRAFRTSHKWFNYLPCGWHHKVICYEPVYTLMFMGKRKCTPTVRLKESGRKLKHERFFTIND
jgi:hypothetical protein